MASGPMASPSSRRPCSGPRSGCRPEAPFGSYDVDVKLFAGGNMIVRVNSAFEVVKVGFEQFVANAARDYGLLYGIATAMMALLTGWFASVVFRRD